MAFGEIAVGPLPFFVEAQAAVGKSFRSRYAFAGAKTPGGIDVMVARVQAAIAGGDRNHTTEPYLATCVGGPDARTLLPVTESGVDATVAVRCV